MRDAVLPQRAEDARSTFSQTLLGRCPFAPCLWASPQVALHSEPLLWALTAPRSLSRGRPRRTLSVSRLFPPVPLTPAATSEPGALPKLLRCLSLAYVFALHVLGHLPCAWDPPHGAFSSKSSAGPSAHPSFRRSLRNLINSLPGHPTPNLPLGRLSGHAHHHTPPASAAYTCAAPSGSPSGGPPLPCFRLPCCLRPFSVCKPREARLIHRLTRRSEFPLSSPLRLCSGLP